jgi:hypothetical protein
MGKKSKTKDNQSHAYKNKDNVYVPCDSNLYDNSMIKAAMAALSDEDKEKYKQIGNELYGTINFENGKLNEEVKPPLEEALAYIKSQLLSGMHPSMLEDIEKELLKENYGDEWYIEWGYIKDDLTDIVTVKPERKV